MTDDFTSGTRETWRRTRSPAARFALTLAVVVWLAGCGGYVGSNSPQPGAADKPISRDDPSGVVAGLVFNEPISLEQARTLGTELDGDLIALYRTDYAFAQPITVVTDMSGTGSGQLEPSRFTFGGLRLDRSGAPVEVG